MTDEVQTEEKKSTKKPKFIVQTLADPETLCRVDTWISTQCLPLDFILGGKGLPVRRVVEIYGDNSTGKSLLATAVCAETQRMGGMAAYADCEIAQHPPRMEVLGIKPAELLYCNPKTVDDVFEALDEFISYRNAKHPGVPLTFVWDSLAAIATMAELEHSEKDGVEGRQYPDVPRALSQAYRQNINKFAEQNVLFLITNQTREKLGLFVGDGVATTGGKATKFYASIRIELQTRGKIKDNKRVIGANVQATIVKNRLAAPYQTALLPVYYKFGIDEAEATLEYLKDAGIVTVSGPWYTMNGDENKFQRKQWPDIFVERFDEVAALLESLK